MLLAPRQRAVVFALVTCSPVGSAHAEAPEPPAGPAASESPRFHLVYEASLETCPNAPAFLGAIRARTDQPRLAAPGEEAVTITVTISRGPAEQVIGRLVIREVDDSRQERTVESRTCEEVAKALALVSALYLDPDAGTAPEPMPPPPPPARASKPRQLESSELPPRSAPPVGFGVGAAAGVLSGVGPALAPRAGLFGEATYEAARSSWLRPSIRLGLDFATSEGDVAVGDQRYFLVSGALRGCPIDVPLLRTLRVGPCAGVEVGVHRGSAAGVPNARAQDKAWLSPTATLRSSVELSGLVSVELEGGIAVPLVETRFFLAPDLTLFRTPTVSARASASVIVRVP